MLVELSVCPHSILYFSRVGTCKCQLDYRILTLEESESIGFSRIGNMACRFCNFEVKLHVLALSFSSGKCRMDYTVDTLVFDMSYLYLFGKSKIVMP